MDSALDTATNLIRGGRSPVVTSFFDEPTNLATHVVHDPETLNGAIIDPVLDYDAASGRTSTASAEKIVAHVETKGLTVQWLLETHVHADHLSAAPWLRERLGGTLAIGSSITEVQSVFAGIFNAGPGFATDGSQFDKLFTDGARFSLGVFDAVALHVPGHTPADLAYVIGDTVFTGDTLFMPDYGTARADFPGGDPRQLYRSIRRLLSLPTDTRLFLCHDYKTQMRNAYRWETTVGEQRAANIHVKDGIGEDVFIAMRSARDATLGMPVLMLPSVQVNMRGGHLPAPEENGTRYLKIPLNTL